jgi:CheY-like chemotaxis protein
MEIPSGESVLVVEDDPNVLQLLEEVIYSEGHVPIGVSHPSGALESARRHRPSLVLVDIMLPGRSGIDVAQELRDHGFKHTPMVAMSASNIMRELAMHTDLFQASIGKPFDIDRFCELVQRLLVGKAGMAETSK